MTCAVVFGYGDVGIRCLAAMLARGWSVPLVVTHEDDPAENRWFGSLAQFASERDIPVMMPENSDDAALIKRVASAQPEFIFSFYYRRMLRPDLLALASRGALNMHGSLLPRFRGRAPINWAILHGETQTGATLHYMVAQPDAGAIVGQRAVPILPDDTAVEVFRKVCSAAEGLLYDALPPLADGTAASTEQNLAAGSYFGARRPDDGIIDWSQSAQRIHDLVRAVAPPFPGARTTLDGRPARIFRTLLSTEVFGPSDYPSAFSRDGRCYVSCGDRRALRILELEIDGEKIDPKRFSAQLAAASIRLPLRTTP